MPRHVVRDGQIIVKGHDGLPRIGDKHGALYIPADRKSKGASTGTPQARSVQTY